MDASSAPSAGERVRDARLLASRWLSPTISEFEFGVLDGAPWPDAGPGSHVDVHLPSGEVRQYSVIEHHARGCTIAARREAQGRGGSRHLHERLRVGDVLRLGEPRNQFRLDATARYSVLIAGGIGITPMLPMLRQLMAAGRPWELHHASRESPPPFASRLAGLGAGVHLYAGGGTAPDCLDIGRVVALAPADATFYCCGPRSMLDDFARHTAHLQTDRARVESFDPVQTAEAMDGYTVVLARQGREVHVAPGTTLLQSLIEAGVYVPYACQQGICGSCETSVLQGRPDHRDAILSPTERATGRTMMVCCSGSLDERLVLDL